MLYIQTKFIGVQEQNLKKRVSIDLEQTYYRIQIRFQKSYRIITLGMIDKRLVHFGGNYCPFAIHLTREMYMS